MSETMTTQRPELWRAVRGGFWLGATAALAFIGLPSEVNTPWQAAAVEAAMFGTPITIGCALGAFLGRTVQGMLAVVGVFAVAYLLARAI